MMQGEFTLEMFIKAQGMMKKMGSMGDLMKMMGMGGMLGINSTQQEQLASEGETILKRYETAYNSMTKAERVKPQIIDMSRRRRIARGSGLRENELGKMLNEFEKMRAMFSQFSKMLGGLPMAGLAGGGAGGGMPFGGGNSLSGGIPGGLKGPAGKMNPQDLARELGQLQKDTKRAAPNFPGFPFSGPGGGYYRKKKK